MPLTFRNSIRIILKGNPRKFEFTNLPRRIFWSSKNPVATTVHLNFFLFEQICFLITVVFYIISVIFVLKGGK